MILQSLIYTTFILFSLGQIGRISFFGQQVNIYLYELSAGLLFLFFFITYRFDPVKESYKRLKWGYIFLGYLVLSFALRIFHYKPVENFIGLLYLFRLVFYWLYLNYLLHWVKKSDKNRLVLKTAILMLIFLICAISLIQYFFYPELRNLSYAGWDPHLFRAFGVFFDASVAGAIYGSIFLFSFFSPAIFKQNKVVRFFFLFIYSVLIVLTFSRNLYLSIFTTFFFFAITRKLYKQFLLLLLLFMLFIWLSPKPFGESVNLTRVFSITSRIEDYKNGFKVWQKSPLTGIGYNRIRYEKIKLNIIEGYNSDITHSGASFHSSFLLILAAGGLIGLVFFLLWLTDLVRLAETSSYLILFLSLMSLADNILLHPFILFILFSIITWQKVNPSRK